MEVCAKLESFLELHEVELIPETIKHKIAEYYSNINQQVSDLKNENLELNAILERQQFEFEKEVSTSQQQLENTTETCSKLKQQIVELEENLNSVQKQWRDLQKLHDSSMLELQTVKRENELLNVEKKNLAEHLEKRRAEIEKLNGEMKNLLEQTSAANEAKFEAIAAAEEAKMKQSNLQHQVTRFQQEKELLNRQIADLNSELNEKNHEIHTLKREKSNNILDLKTQLENKVDEIHLLQKKIDCYKESIDEKDHRIEALAEKIRHLNQTHSKAEEQFNLELNAQTKLIDLHKNASEENQKRVQELMSAFEEAQKLLKESIESCEEMEKHSQEIENKCKEQCNEKQKEITFLKNELKKLKDSGHGLNKETIEKIFPIAAATSKVLHSGMTLTDLYVEYTKLQEELQQQKSDNAKLTQELKQIVTEIEEKTPLINQRMMEYEKCKDTISCLKSQLAGALVDYEKMLEERNDSKRISNSAERENTRLKTQVLDLNRQVQVLLKEVEEARGGRIMHNRSKNHGDDRVTSSDDVTADKVISRHLVTFRDIEEIQTKNQKLLAVIRDLSQQHEEMEKKLSSEITAKFQKDIETLTAQLDDLQQKRCKQSEMLETIIRQRDMYRVLLTSQGFSESLLGQSDGSLSVLQSTSKLSSSDPRLKETKIAMNQLQAEFKNYKKEKCENERLLNEQLDKMRSELSDLRLKNGRLTAQCEFSDERLKMMQSNIETYKKEHASFKEKNKQHTSMMVQHQQTIGSLRQDLMIAQEKLSKSEVTIENLKAERDLLKNVEARLLQEKESIMKEQHHQSRVMANLQVVQNNLERIESETKRNLQFQVEKLEKETSILKTKLDNANEEYRAAVKIWEKQNKDLQQKIDIEIERNRKLHEDLVDAYSQVHVIKQELVSTKSQIPATPEKGTPEAAKTSQKSTPVASPSVAEVKQLKEQLNETQMKMKSLQDKLDITGKSSEQYQSMCKDLEIRVKEQDEINRQLQQSMDSALSSSKKAQSSLEKNLEEMEKTNRQLIEENMKLTQNSGSQVNELQKKVAELLKSIEDYKKQAETAKVTAEQARADCQNQLKLMQDVQEKYERELMLHAQDMQKMTELKEEHQTCSAKMEKLSEEASVAGQALAESRESWSKREQILVNETEALKKRLADLEQCNRNLHEQLDLMGTQMAALQSKNWDETPYGSIQSDLKDTQHLLQVIQFIKKEKEIACTQYDVAQSENVRLNIKVEQLTSELNEARAELKEVMGNFQAKAASDAQHTELLKKVEMMNLLSESNNLLRMEKESLTTAKTKLETQLHELEEKLQPLIEKEKELGQQNDMFAAENSALRTEVKSWQSRTNQLLEQSHKIGPQEYKNMMREIEELKNQKTRLAEELQKKQAEVSQLTANCVAHRKELENAKIAIRDKIFEVAKMNKDITEHQKTVLQIKKIGRKYKTQYDELKLSHDALVAKTKAAETTNQEQAMQELQKKNDESEKTIKELKDELEKEKETASLAKQSADAAQSKTNEREEKTKKLLSQFRQKFSQVNNLKESLSEENKKLTKEIEENKIRISELLTSQKESTQNKSQYDVTITRLEKELRKANELRISERDYLQKQYDELCQKVAQQKQSIKPSIGLGERASGSGTEPLTANIKPLTSPSTSGVSSSLRHSSHPHAATAVARPTPTASIRPMAIGTVSASPAPSSQTRMAAVLPTTATPPHTEEDSIFAASGSTSTVSVPHAVQPLVQPIPATATVAPTTMAVTVSPVISDVSAPEITESSIPEEEHRNEALQTHVIGIQVSPSPVTALVTPRIDVTDVSLEQGAGDSPAPTTSVIVSPPATQVVTPTVKRPREESASTSDVGESSLKRVRMVSEGSQTNQQLSTAPPVTSASNIAVVSAAQIVPRNKSPGSETHLSVPTVDVKEMPIAVIASPQPSTSAVVDESIVPTPEAVDAQILEDDEKDQNIEWEPQDDTKIDEEYEAEVMEEETVIDETEELEEDVEQMQGIDAKSPDDEDMPEEQQEEEMVEQPSTSTADIDILDSTSDIQMDADSSSLQTAPSDQVMAPPSFPPTLEVATRSDAPPAMEAILGTGAALPVQSTSLPIGPPRLDRQAPISRQPLTPFTIPGQGSNFEEGDDSIVPSTPTLYVPRRTDGFAEAVSSPHVPQVRFSFSSSDNSPTQQTYAQSQLATQALGVDDTRMDLFDEGGSRAVPSTPLPVTLSSEIIIPDLPEQILENDPSEVASGIEIKIELVQDPVETSISPTMSTKEQSHAAVASTDAPTDITKSETAEGKAESSAAESDAAGDVAKVAASSETQSSEEGSKAEEGQESDQQNKDGTANQTSQRKPIVWRKNTSEAPSTSAETANPAVTSVPPSVRGRARARRAMYSGVYSRGRGETSWLGPGRGRRRGGRRSMY